MLTKEEIKIIDFFRKDLFKKYSIRKIMIKLSKKSYSGVFNIIKKLKKIGIVKIEKIGHTNICSLDLNNS